MEWEAVHNRTLAALNHLNEQWIRARNSVTLSLFALSGSLTAGSFQHVAQTCKGGNCLGCGNCAFTLAAAVASASAGVVGRTSGRKRLLLLAVVLLVGLMLYGLLTAWKSGVFSGGAS